MKLAVTLSLFSVSSAAVLEVRGECHGNNCNRAVTGTREGLLPFASRSADCSSFMLATVTPAPTTVTVTLSLTPSVYEKRDAPVIGRQVTVSPNSIPQYAENCINLEEYSTACSCFGITASVTTAPTPTVTVTTTANICYEGGDYL